LAKLFLGKKDNAKIVKLILLFMVYSEALNEIITLDLFAVIMEKKEKNTKKYDSPLRQHPGN
jgi:hypothetical protein